MHNLHCHSLLSDGVLLPSEVAMRYMAKGYKRIAITDHVDYSNIDATIEAILKFCTHWPRDMKIKVLPGIELTHLPLSQFKPLVKYSRSKGIKVVVGHGETLAEPVLKGTNCAALEAEVDILAHPGLITKEEIKLAKKKGIFLEITSRPAHSETNSYVAEEALSLGAELILNTDSHLPEDIIGPEELLKVGRYAGLDKKAIDKIYKDTAAFISKL